MPSKLIALTGGIGSGKSTALGVIKRLGYKTIDLDEVYSDLLKNISFLQELSKIMEVFPIVDGEGNLTLDRKAVAEKVFNSPTKLKKLNEFTHPKIIKEAKRIAERENGAVFCEVPLLYESNLQNDFDYVIVTVRQLSERVKSVEKRDGLSESEILKRIKSQFDYANLQPDGHTIIIENFGDEVEFIGKVERAVEKILG